MHIYNYQLVVAAFFEQNSENIMKSILAFIPLYLILATPVSGVAGDKALHMAYPDYAPYYSSTADGKVTGIFYELIHEIMESRMHVDVIWEEYPWKRCQSYVENGLADAMITTLTPERLEFAATHTHPLFVLPVIVFTYVGHPKFEYIKEIATFEDILKANLTVISYLGNGWVKKNAGSLGIEVIWTSEQDDVWSMLALQRGDIALDWPCFASPRIRKQNLEDKVLQTDAVVQSVSFYLLVNKKSQFTSLLPLFDETVQEMDADGTIHKIINAYCQ